MGAVSSRPGDLGAGPPLRAYSPDSTRRMENLLTALGAQPGTSQIRDKQDAAVVSTQSCAPVMAGKIFSFVELPKEFVERCTARGIPSNGITTFLSMVGPLISSIDKNIGIVTIGEQEFHTNPNSPPAIRLSIGGASTQTEIDMLISRIDLFINQDQAKLINSMEKLSKNFSTLKSEFDQISMTQFMALMTHHLLDLGLEDGRNIQEDRAIKFSIQQLLDSLKITSQDCPFQTFDLIHQEILNELMTLSSIDDFFLDIGEVAFPFGAMATTAAKSTGTGVRRDASEICDQLDLKAEPAVPYLAASNTQNTPAASQFTESLGLSLNKLGQNFGNQTIAQLKTLPFMLTKMGYNGGLENPLNTGAHIVFPPILYGPLKAAGDNTSLTHQPQSDTDLLKAISNMPPNSVCIISFDQLGVNNQEKKDLADAIANTIVNSSTKEHCLLVIESVYGVVGETAPDGFIDQIRKYSEAFAQKGIHLVFAHTTSKHIGGGKTAAVLTSNGLVLLRKIRNHYNTNGGLGDKHDPLRSSTIVQEALKTSPAKTDYAALLVYFEAGLAQKGFQPIRY